MTTHAMAPLPELPDAIDRPKWAFFLWSRALSPDDVAPLFEAAGLPRHSREFIRQLGLPWDHPKRAKPLPEEVAFIAAWSRGEVGEPDWTAPRRVAVAA